MCNLYSSGESSVGWHSDDEPQLGEEPEIVSVSLGERRDLYFKRKSPEFENEITNFFKVSLTNGSLLWMSDRLQLDWLHSIPKVKKVRVGPRISITFRYLNPLTNDDNVSSLYKLPPRITTINEDRDSKTKILPGRTQLYGRKKVEAWLFNNFGILNEKKIC